MASGGDEPLGLWNYVDGQAVPQEAKNATRELSDSYKVNFCICIIIRLCQVTIVLSTKIDFSYQSPRRRDGTESGKSTTALRPDEK